MLDHLSSCWLLAHSASACAQSEVEMIERPSKTHLAVCYDSFNGVSLLQEGHWFRFWFLLILNPRSLADGRRRFGGTYRLHLWVEGGWWPGGKAQVLGNHSRIMIDTREDLTSCYELPQVRGGGCRCVRTILRLWGQCVPNVQSVKSTRNAKKYFFFFLFITKWISQFV